MYACMHVRAPAHSHTHTHTHTHTHSDTHTLTHSLTHSLSLSLTHTHAYAGVQTLELLVYTYIRTWVVVRVQKKKTSGAMELDSPGVRVDMNVCVRGHVSRVWRLGKGGKGGWVSRSVTTRAFALCLRTRALCKSASGVCSPTCVTLDTLTLTCMVHGGVG